MDLALNNLQRLICHKTNQTKPGKEENIEIRHEVKEYTDKNGCQMKTGTREKAGEKY